MLPYIIKEKLFMALVLYDKEMKAFDQNPLRSFHDGFTGEIFEEKFYIKNLDKSRYYTDITLEPKFKSDYKDLGEYGDTGWSIKLMYGERRPTDEEWSLMPPGAMVNIPDIGSVDRADTIRRHPIWVRIFCPGNTLAQIKTNMFIDITYYEKVVNV